MTLTTKQIKLTLAGAATFLAFLAPSLAFADETITYTVKPGDTLSEIAEKYNTTVEKLAEKKQDRGYSSDLCGPSFGHRRDSSSCDNL